VDSPYVLLSCAMSLDGYIGDASGQRLILSGEQDRDEVDELRAWCDAICVGAGTVRADDPRLLLRSAARRQARAARGLPPDPARVILGGGVPAGARVLASGPRPLVYAASQAVRDARGRVGAAAEVVPAGDPPDLRLILADLAARGVGRLLVEGGGTVHTAFLTAGLADELRLAVAPFFVGDPAAPRFAGPGAFPWNRGHRSRLIGAAQVGDMAVLRYALSDRAPAGGPRPCSGAPPAARP